MPFHTTMYVPLQIYLILVLSQAYDKIIDHGLSSPAHGRDMVDNLNTTNKCFIFQFMTIVQLFGYKGYNIQISMHYVTHKYYVSSAR